MLLVILFYNKIYKYYELITWLQVCSVFLEEINTGSCRLPSANNQYADSRRNHALASVGVNCSSDVKLIGVNHYNDPVRPFLQ